MILENSNGINKWMGSIDDKIKHVAESGKQLKWISEKLWNKELKKNFKKLLTSSKVDDTLNKLSRATETYKSKTTKVVKENGLWKLNRII